MHTYAEGAYNATHTEIPTIIDASATKKYPSATGSIIVGISVVYIQVFDAIRLLRFQMHSHACVVK